MAKKITCSLSITEDESKIFVFTCIPEDAGEDSVSKVLIEHLVNTLDKAMAKLLDSDGNVKRH